MLNPVFAIGDDGNSTGLPSPVLTPPAALTVRLYKAVLISGVAVPLTVMEVVPVGVPPVVDIVNVDEQVGLHDNGENEQDAPAGNPAQLNVTGCVVPETRLDVTVVEVELPCVTLPELGLADMEKSNNPVTCTEVEPGM